MASQEKSREIQRIAETLGVKQRYLQDLVAAGVLVGDLEFVVETVIALISDPEREDLIGVTTVASVWSACGKDEDLFEEVVDTAFDIEKGPANQRLLEAAKQHLHGTVETTDRLINIDTYDDESIPDYSPYVERQEKE